MTESRVIVTPEREPSTGSMEGELSDTEPKAGLPFGQDDLSTTQPMVSSVPGGGKPATSGDWGLKHLAIEPGAVEMTREARGPMFAALPDTASSMFDIQLRTHGLVVNPELLAEIARLTRPEQDEQPEVIARLEQLIGTNDLRPAYWLEEGATRSRAVCKLEASGTDYDGRTGSWSGTGFLVAPGILCTNHHVLNSKEVAARSRALFDFAALPGGGFRQVGKRGLKVALRAQRSTG